MFSLCLLDPEDIVEQQFVMVGRSQSLQTEVRSMDDNLPQCANL